MRSALAVLVSLTLCAAPSCGLLGPPAPTSEIVGGIRTINASQLERERAEGRVHLLVDVRTPEEYADGHVPGALNIPLDQLDAHMGELATYKQTEVHLICRSGSRSLAASQALLARGYLPVNVGGGTEGWKQAGYAVE